MVGPRLCAAYVILSFLALNLYRNSPRGHIQTAECLGVPSGLTSVRQRPCFRAILRQSSALAIARDSAPRWTLAHDLEALEQVSAIAAKPNG
jgi:hypothetical protein